MPPRATPAPAPSEVPAEVTSVHAAGASASLRAVWKLLTRQPFWDSRPLRRVLAYLEALPGLEGPFYQAYCEGGSAGRSYYSADVGRRWQLAYQAAALAQLAGDLEAAEEVLGAHAHVCEVAGDIGGVATSIRPLDRHAGRSSPERTITPAATQRAATPCPIEEPSPPSNGHRDHQAHDLKARGAGKAARMQS